jgi:dipeptidyl aminopeptidase/acylaminoacyl peptidase
MAATGAPPSIARWAPELEDYVDGLNWMVAKQQGDAANVGIYGGSYGGFMTFMALLRAPDQFKAGAALRPVTDWTTYNHEYTANILNTPELDPQAYKVVADRIRRQAERPHPDRPRHDRR